MVEKLVDELSFSQQRMHRKSKSRFREYLKSKAVKLDLEYSEKPKTIFAKNVVIGDLEKAKFVLTAHYDTPPRMPAFLMRSVLFFNIAALVIVLGLFILFPLLELPVILLPLIYMLLFFHTMGFGIANKYNFNDNSSGVITVLGLMESLKNQEVAYVFFDNEEKGLLGSFALSKYMKKNKQYDPKNKIFINFDCVGRGNTFVINPFSYKRVAREIIEAGNEFNEFAFEIKRPSVLAASDHFAFAKYHSLGIMCYNKKGKKYKMNDIHSHKDKNIKKENIEILINAIQKVVDRGIE